MENPGFAETDGSKLPSAPAADADLELAARHAPIILFDEREPFLPLVVGYTVFRREGRSPSFARIIERAYLPEWSAAVEYAIWWDWDIGHLYELEHVWSFVNASGELVWVEGSFHGQYLGMQNGSGVFTQENARPVVYSQPGKHAFSGEAVMFNRIQYLVFRETDLFAGQGGVLVKDMYQGKIAVQAGDNERVAAYLKRHAFTPTLNFSRRFEISAEMLVPWPVLDGWIPARVGWWLEQLRHEAEAA